jgi:hypothetical protein
MNKTRREFEKRVGMILQKVENKTDYKRDFESLHKDKLFVDEKPYSDFFALEKLSEEHYSTLLQKEMEGVGMLVNQLTSIYSKEKTKPEVRVKDVTKLM